MEFSIFHIGKSEWWISYRKYVTFYISYTKMWVQIFLHEVWNLYFMFENLAVYVWSWYMEYCMFHIWIYVHIFLCMKRESCIIHIGKFEHPFSCWIMEFYFHKWISQLNFLTRYPILYSSNMKFQKQIFIPEIQNVYISQMKI